MIFKLTAIVLTAASTWLSCAWAEMTPESTADPAASEAAAESQTMTDPAASDEEAAPQIMTDPAQTIERAQTLEIVVYREPDLSGKFRVDESGYVGLPLLGNLDVGGKTLEQVRQDIVSGLKKFLIDPQVSIAIETRGPGGPGGVPGGKSASFVTIMGEVRQPGAVEIGEEALLSQVIAQAGGFTPVADTRRVKLIRKGTSEGSPQNVMIVDIESVNEGGAEDPVVEKNDKIVVPQEAKDANTAAILGEVKLAGMYEVTPGFTLMRLIAKAGGFTPLAATNKIRLVRQSDGRKQVMVYNAAPIINGQADDPEVHSGDMVFVPETFF